MDSTKFYKMVLIDCGRGFYTTASIRQILDTMADCGYDALMLGFGNDGLRFLLDDMTVKMRNCCLDSQVVKDGIISGNVELGRENGCCGQWTQPDMDEIFSYATARGIEIVPFLNSPGHAWVIGSAMKKCGIEDSCYESSGQDLHNISVNLENPAAVDFLEGLMKKYIAYFTEKGCTFFNLGCDEIGGNAGGQSEAVKAEAVSYITDLCSAMPDTMTPMAFCDVLGSCTGIPENLVGIDWYGQSLEEHFNFNASYLWYYVLGNSETEDGWSTYYRAMQQTKATPVTETLNKETAYGSILAVWNDHFVKTGDYVEKIQNLIRSQAEANPRHFEKADYSAF